MEKLNKYEIGIIKRIAKDTRIKYLRKNKYIFSEGQLEKKVLELVQTDEDYINIEDSVTILEFANIFTDKSLSKKAKKLNYIEKKILYLYFVLEKTDREIAVDLKTSRQKINRKRNEIIKKLKK